MGKKRGLFWAGLLLAGLLASGCDGKQIDAVTKIQSQETITVEELTLVARTENMNITGQDYWQTEEGLPVTVLQTRAGDLLLIWDCDQVPGGRAAVEAAGWTPRCYWAGEDKPPVVEQALAQYGEQPAEQYFCYPFTAKNLLVYALVPGQAVSECGEGQTAVYTDVQPGNVRALRQLFWQDVNGAESNSFRAVSDQYEVSIGHQQYSTAMTSGGRSYYDHAVLYLLECRLSNPQAFTPGEPITVTVQGPYSGMKASMSVTLEALSAETVWVLNSGPQQWTTETALEEEPHYTVTFTSGTQTETLELVDQLQTKIDRSSAVNG